MTNSPFPPALHKIRHVPVRNAANLVHRKQDAAARTQGRRNLLKNFLSVIFGKINKGIPQKNQVYVKGKIRKFPIQKVVIHRLNFRDKIPVKDKPAVFQKSAVFFNQRMKSLPVYPERIFGVNSIFTLLYLYLYLV